ncbi:MAG: N(2)-fixation sustaining protein CowN [Formivibrio sp.]|nr:N(2)-fixation sustaining protein CowN [Formivibrio sp.]
MNPSDTPCGCRQESTEKSDRYVSFKGIDCDGNAKRLIAYLRRHIDIPEKTNPFWEQFKQKLNPTSGPRYDELYLVHAYINIIREYLELMQDAQALALLDQLEEECC